MPFSNTWDQTFPPDTQQASLGGSDLRLLRVDTQQRMAAISGLDASKPAFGSDAQPAAWNGILFFATDTGKIYQWNNPSWTEVTPNFRLSTTAFYKTTTPVVNTGNITRNTIATIPLPAMAQNASLFRIEFGVRIDVLSSGATFYFTINGTDYNLGTTGTFGNQFVCRINLSVTTTTNLVAIEYVIGQAAAGAFTFINVPVANLNAQNMLIKVQSGVNADQQTLYFVSAESL